MKEPEPVNLERGFMVIQKIAECYEAANRLFGRNYIEKTKGIREALKCLMRESGCNEVSAGLAILHELKENGHQSSMGTLLVCAVVFELIEAK